MDCGMMLTKRAMNRHVKDVHAQQNVTETNKRKTSRKKQNEM